MKKLILILLLVTSSCTLDQTNFEENATVKKIIDGDTYLIDVNGSEEKIRLLGIDYPDLTKDRITNFLDLGVVKNKVQDCYKKGKEDLEKNLVGKNMIIIRDPNEKDRDKYKRLLRYAEFNNTDIGAWLLQNGYARFYDPTNQLCNRCIYYHLIYSNITDSKIGCLWE